MKSIDITAREYAVHMVGSDSYEQNDLEEGFKAGGGRICSRLDKC